MEEAELVSYPDTSLLTSVACGSGNSDVTGYIGGLSCADIACHQPKNAPAKLHIKANAGDEVTFHWSKWPSHPGAMTTYST